MVACPSDVTTGLSITSEAIARWNVSHSREKRVVLLPLSWRTHSSPEMGEPPQKILNKQLLEKSDLLVAIFWTRIGTATGDAESGTVEEIREHIKAGKPVMIYFCEKEASPHSLDLEQFAKLAAIRAEFQAQGLIDTYTRGDELRDKVERHLNDKVRDHPYFKRADLVPEVLDFRSSTPPTLSHEAKEFLDAAAQDNGDIRIFDTLRGKTFHAGKKVVCPQHPRDRARYEVVIDDLEKSGFVRSAVGTHRGILLEVTEAGYKYIETGSTTDQVNKDAAQQALFSNLSRSLDEVIADLSKHDLPRLEPQQHLEKILSENISALNNADFLKRARQAIEPFHPWVDDRNRRQSLFDSLDRLLLDCSDFHKRTFKAALTAQIRDSAAFMFIMQALAEEDEDVLRIFPRLGINFSILNACPKFAKELDRRFGESAVI